MFSSLDAVVQGFPVVCRRLTLTSLHGPPDFSAGHKLLQATSGDLYY